MRFSKYHALGNDYLVLTPADAEDGQPPSMRDIQLICHRNFGIGSDGILYGPLVSENAEFGLRIFNPDGSEAEKSGNGLRIFSRFLFDQQLVSEQAFTIDTPGGIVTCQIHENGKLITVEMGKVSFHSDIIPVKGESREVLNEVIEIAGTTYSYYAATIGNPHAVLPLDEISEKLACEIGPIIENHENFPNRTNMQLLRVLDRNNIQIEIWERGAGYTLASGSSSSAAAAVAHKMGKTDEAITVHMPGGKIIINIGDDYAITMSGPATRVATVDFDKEALSFELKP